MPSSSPPTPDPSGASSPASSPGGSASFADRPPPDPERFLASLDEFDQGDVPPGTTVQALKRGGLDELLVETVSARQQVGTDVTSATQVLEVWNRWERGQATPGETLTALAESGLRALLQEVLDTQQEAFG